MKKFFNEFKAFISRGNVMDMAVGIIIGGAFTSIVSSLVEDIITPILGLFGGSDFNRNNRSDQSDQHIQSNQKDQACHLCIPLY